MTFIEAPTNFYLGRQVDPTTMQMTDDVVYYDSRDLTTHAVVVGMTGSGKTGLCITLLEEAILDNIPAIVIDPKGDITNLLLTFPNLQPLDFESWVNPDDARRAGMDVPTFAKEIADKWRDGLQDWGIVPDRLKWLQYAARYSIYTPGSDAGLPISILASLRAPQDGWQGNGEAHRERISGIVTALLALAGIDAEPVKDAEHVLLSNIFEHNWKQGRDVNLADIVLQVQQPPFETLGVLPVDQYISEKKRYQLAMTLNNIIAAPSFQSWIHGEPLNIQNMLYQANGRPKVSVFYTAHLNETERMFITTLILESMLSWMRTQSGTTSLRALLYIDEIYGYFPPYPKNPPTKEPLLRLIKQARAFGVGMILATQNPGDLDYKSLSNAGTWFIGRLQAENDRRRIMAGLEEMADASEELDLDDMAQIVSGIKPRTFLMRNVHNAGKPLVLHSRWAMNYLAGPLTRTQITQLMATQRQELMARLAQQPVHPQQPLQPAMPPLPPGFDQSVKGQDPTPPTPPTAPPATPVSEPAQPQFIAQAQTTSLPQPSLPPGLTDTLPPVKSSIQQFYLPNNITAQHALGHWERHNNTQAGRVQHMLAYQPILFAQASVRYQKKTAQIYTTRQYAFHVPNLALSGLVHWDEHQAAVVESRELTSQAAHGALFGVLPSGFSDEKRLKALKGELTDMLYNTARLVIPHNPKFKMYGNPDEDISQFRAELVQRAREARDIEVDKLSERYNKKLDTIEDRIRRKEHELDAEQAEIRDRRREQLYTTGEAALSLFRGRTNYTLSRMSRASRYKRQAEADIRESRSVLRDLDDQMAGIQTEYERKLHEVNDEWARIANNVQEHVITPYKKDIHIELFGLGWLPYWLFVIGGQAVYVQAFQ